MPSLHYAVATTDTAFKHMLSITNGHDIIISFLNSFIPAFRGDHIASVEEASVAIPALKRPGEKQTFMDLHVICNSNIHYIVEMQAQRHVMFDERALFYAASTYSRQLTEKQLSSEDWYIKLNPVIALQILDYDTNRVRGITAVVPDTLGERVAENPLPEGEFIKHYMLIYGKSRQVIDYLQMVQVELPRAEKIRKLFPPKQNFSPTDWWLSLLKHANDYTDELIDQYKMHMPKEIYEALKRLDLRTFSSKQVKEYQEDINRKELYQTTLAVERCERRAEVRAEGLAEGLAKAIKANKMTRDDAIAIGGLGEVEIIMMDQIIQDQA